MVGIGRVGCDFDGIMKHEAISLRRKGHISYFIAWLCFNGNVSSEEALRNTRYEVFASFDISVQRQDIYTRGLYYPRSPAFRGHLQLSLCPPGLRGSPDKGSVAPEF